MSYWKWMYDILKELIKLKNHGFFILGLLIILIGPYVSVFSFYYLAENINFILGIVVFILTIFFEITYAVYLMEK